MVELRELLPWPAADANKYSRGKLLVVGGSTRYPGAAILAAKAAARSGAGYVTLAVPEDIAQVAQSHLLTVPVMACDSEDGVFSEDAALQLLAACGRCDAVLMGPGLTREAASLGGLLELFVLGCEAPLLLDADALALAATPEMAALLRERAAGGWTTVMTPHDGE
ncbi:MAG: bifunctional ADP-dependent NAD(P)H-hydrate dehydratase/NAD(P)H-hydrate epimerase, partial [Coriobacteriales bacterium]|nr:bifunctional ADP-dependent NAD(P)H-hydrate dehydratase/NAD(P)H-hydrate epimerase [Coriobacteriales bacterium]